MREIIWVFSRLGVLGFGGPLATLAMMEEETSRRRGWVDSNRFTEMYAVCKVLPGPVATQMAIYLGYTRGGIAGGIAAGTCFILPSFLIVMGLSYLYVQAGSLFRASWLFTGMQVG